jgi:hypothetical protein
MPFGSTSPSVSSGWTRMLFPSLSCRDVFSESNNDLVLAVGTRYNLQPCQRMWPRRQPKDTLAGRIQCCSACAGAKIVGISAPCAAVVSALAVPYSRYVNSFQPCPTGQKLAYITNVGVINRNENSNLTGATMSRLECTASGPEGYP